MPRGFRDYSVRKQISDLLKDNGSGLGNLFEKADQLGRLQRLFNQALPSSLRDQVALADCNNGVLTVVVANAMLANQVRMGQHEILQKLREQEAFAFVYQIRPKVKPVSERPRKKRQIKPISKKNAELLLQEARHCDDEELRKVLESLASHAGDS